jgi:cytochrome c-type biogenesis protein CcmF
MTMPIGMALLFLMAIAPVLPWRKASGELLRHRLLWPAWIGVGAMVLSVALGARGLAPVIAFGLGGFAGGSAGRQLVLAARRQGWRGLVGRANGGMVVHLGVVLIAVAFAASSSYVRQAEFTLQVGQSASFSGHTLIFEGTNTRQESAKIVQQALVRIDGTGPWAPSLNKFANGSQTIGTPSVRSTLTDDVALSVIDIKGTETQVLTLRVTVQPLIIWLWIGGGVMALGTLLAVFPGRRRNPLDPVSAPTAASGRPRLPEPTAS